MRGVVAKLPFVLAILPCALVGCHREYRESVDRWYEVASSPSRAEPATDVERTALARLDELGPGPETIVLSDATVRVEPIYASAAHLLCRGFVVQREPADGAPMRRVACKETDGWFLVPDLLEDGSMDGPEDMP